MDLMALTEVNSLGIKDLEVKTADIAADAVTGAKIADDQIDSEHYVDGSIDHAHLANDCVDGDNIADNSVGLAHMAGGTDGVIITYDASGDPVHVGPGNDGQVLTSTGAGSPPAFEDLPSSGVTVSNNVNNRVVTGDGTNLNAEAGLTCDGTHLSITDGNLVIATAGHGIDFSATADAGATGATATAELLDWYEYGDWTPTFEGSGSATMVTQYGKYTRIGNMCHAYCLVGWSTFTGSGSITIGGMPFDTAHNYSPATFGAWDDQIQLSSGYTWPSVYCGSPWDRDYFYLHQHKGDNVSPLTTNISAASNQTFGLSVYYRV